ncbi:hypothetical protein TYRP_003368 [Tyrophagus putrescentiae]|nr:hypothetical protein TYRP_003368 [Tyrophagus putrescentiae]
MKRDDFLNIVRFELRIDKTIRKRGALSEGGNASGKTDHENDGAHHQADVTGGVVPANRHVVRVHPQGTVAANPNGDAEDAHSEGLGKKEKTQLIS